MYMYMYCIHVLCKYMYAFGSVDLKMTLIGVPKFCTKTLPS